MQADYCDGAVVVRDIRILPVELVRQERAIAGVDLVVLYGIMPACPS